MLLWLAQKLLINLFVTFLGNIELRSTIKALEVFPKRIPKVHDACAPTTRSVFNSCDYANNDAGS